MQDKYAGDVGDFGKLGLLRNLKKNGLEIGVNWYKVADEKDKPDGKYEIDGNCEACDEELANAIKSIFKGKRSIKAIENKKLIDNAIYYSEELKINNRHNWHKEALETLKDCSLVFLDPDNGLVAKSAKLDKLPKYVLEEEILDYVNRGQSVVFYNHRSRKDAKEYFDEIRKRLGMPIITITFPKCSVRDYIFVTKKKEHEKIIKKTIKEMVNGVWGENKVCRREYL